MNQKIVHLVLGLVLGAAGALIVVSLLPTGEPTRRRPSADGEVEDLRERVRCLTAQLSETRETPKPAPPETGTPERPVGPPQPDPAQGEAEAEAATVNGPPSTDEIRKVVREMAPALRKLVVGEDAEGMERIRTFFGRVSPGQLAELISELEETGDIEHKILLAHALAQSGRPDALKALERIVLDRSRGFLDRRFVAHGLAFVDGADLDPVLLQVARDDPDVGARANASFGLIRSGNSEGLGLYVKATDQAFKDRDPVAIQYLGGFFLIGEKALPAARERLTTYEERQSQLLLIAFVQKQKDREALPILYRLQNDATRDQSVREAAEKAIREIEKD